MPVLASERAHEIVDGWRRSADPTHSVDNPAGALYAGGTFAEADIVQASAARATNLSTCTTGSIRCCC